MQVGKKILILIEKVNTNYRLPLEVLYGCTILNNHDFRKNSTRPPHHQLRLSKATNTHGSQFSGPKTHVDGPKMGWMEGILRRDVEGSQKEYHRNLSAFSVVQRY
jgi:hypothetical protein